MTNLYIDFDGVICNTIDVTYEMVENLKIDKKDASKMVEFYQNVDWYDVLKKSVDINDGLKRIKKIIDSGKFNVAILTHVNSLDEIKAKLEYIRKHFDIPVIGVPKNVSKANLINAKNSVLIDDYVENLKEWHNAGGLGIRFDLDKDGKGFPVIDRLDDIIEVF